MCFSDELFRIIFNYQKRRQNKETVTFNSPAVYIIPNKVTRIVLKISLCSTCYNRYSKLIDGSSINSVYSVSDIIYLSLPINTIVSMYYQNITDILCIANYTYIIE